MSRGSRPEQPADRLGYGSAIVGIDFRGHNTYLRLGGDKYYVPGNHLPELEI